MDTHRPAIKEIVPVIPVRMVNGDSLNALLKLIPSLLANLEDASQNEIAGENGGEKDGFSVILLYVFQFCNRVTYSVGIIGQSLGTKTRYLVMPKSASNQL